MPADAVADKFDYKFIYQKKGEKKTFTADKLPDSTWSYVDRQQILVQKGKNNVPLINDFSLTDSAGADVTETLLSPNRFYYLFFLKDMEGGTARWSTAFVDFWQKAKQQNRPVYIVTSNRAAINDFFNVMNNYQLPVYTCDATAIKTAARANPTLFLMKGPVVQGKWGWADIDKAF